MGLTPTIWGRGRKLWAQTHAIFLQGPTHSKRSFKRTNLFEMGYFMDMYKGLKIQRNAQLIGFLGMYTANILLAKTHLLVVFCFKADILG